MIIFKQNREHWEVWNAVETVKGEVEPLRREEKSHSQTSHVGLTSALRNEVYDAISIAPYLREVAGITNCLRLTPPCAVFLPFCFMAASLPGCGWWGLGSIVQAQIRQGNFLSQPAISTLLASFKFEFEG